ncbi:integrase, catalytic region, zinc finger, CCHC-type containing protein [Tanacetum coccineum]
MIAIVNEEVTKTLMKKKPRHSIYCLGTSTSSFVRLEAKGTCYNSELEGHFASECRKLKENKAFMGGAWSDSEDGEEHQNDNKEHLKFNKDFTKTFEKLLIEKRALEDKNSKLSSKINDLEIEVKKIVNNKEMVEHCQKCVELTQEVDSLTSNVFKLQSEALNFSKFKLSSIALDDMLSRQNRPKIRKVCLKCDLLLDDWIVDNGCTKHMNGNRRLFSLYKAYDGEHVVFGSNLKGKVVGVGHQGNANKRTRKEVSTTRVLELLHLDLVGPSHIQSYGGNFYTLIIVDDHSNYTWVVFVKSKEDVLEKFKILCRKLENLHDCSIVSIESLNITFDESLPEPKSSPSVEDYTINEPVVQDLNRSSSLQVNISDLGYPKSLKEARGHPIEQVISELDERTLRSKTKQA